MPRMSPTGGGAVDGSPLEDLVHHVQDGIRREVRQEGGEGATLEGLGHGVPVCRHGAHTGRHGAVSGRGDLAVGPEETGDEGEDRAVQDRGGPSRDTEQGARGRVAGVRILTPPIGHGDHAAPPPTGISLPYTAEIWVPVRTHVTSAVESMDRAGGCLITTS